MENNYYFEQLQKFVNNLSDEQLIERISECQFIVEQLTSNKAWDLILKDAKEIVNNMDAHWQEIPVTDPKLSEMRVYKLAYSHLFALPQKYFSDLEFLQRELDERQHKQEIIIKDYDEENVNGV